jgi:enoyl-CoA hydratase
MIEVKEASGIAVLQMQHGKANALDVELCTELKVTLQQVESTSKAVVLTGQGTIFSAGVDLVRLLNDGDEYRSALLTALADVLHALFFYPKPLVAAINGHAIAGGCILACAADHRIMIRDHGKIGVPELTVGLPFPPIALEIMRFATPPQHFRQCVFRGLTYPPDQALAWGLVDELVASEVLSDRAVICATELASIPPRSFELTKSQACRPVVEKLQQKWSQNMAAEVNEVWNSAEIVAAVQAYVDKTLHK